jgi:hypothetical protein
MTEGALPSYEPVSRRTALIVGVATALAAIAPTASRAADCPGPDPRPAASPRALAVIDACEAVWKANSTDCNHFLKAVAQTLGVTFFDASWNANRIVDELMRVATYSPSRWQALASANDARAAAEAGNFVVAGTRGSDTGDVHGHVAVVVAGPMHPTRHVPHGYWGRLGGVGAKNCTLNWAWLVKDLSALKYFVYFRYS